MSNPGTDGSAATVASDGELGDASAEALKMIEQARAALTSVQAKSDEMSRLLADLATISAAFDSVASRLVDAAFRVTGEATRSVPSRGALSAVVEELGRLARLAMGAAGDVRRELKAQDDRRVSTAGALQESDVVLQDLAATVKRMAAPPERSRPPAIEIETIDTAARTPAGRSPARGSSALERAISASTLASRSPKSGGYKN